MISNSSHGNTVASADGNSKFPYLQVSAISEFNPRAHLLQAIQMNTFFDKMETGTNLLIWLEELYIHKIIGLELKVI